MDIRTLELILDTFENDAALELETNLGRRLNVIDLLSFAEGHTRAYNSEADSTVVAERLLNFNRRLNAINTRLFDRLREQIRGGHTPPAELRRALDPYTDYTPQQKGLAHLGPDTLDALLDNILAFAYSPHINEFPSADMIPYHPTPARAVLDMIDNADLKSDDVVYDFGSGLGRVVILTHLLGGVKARGVEIDPELDQSARECALKLGLTGVEFINADVRDVDCAEGTFFFMYTPFTGESLQAVLDKLQREAQRRPIKICTHGPCTAWVAEQPWLESRDTNADSSFKVAIFQSR